MENDLLELEILEGDETEVIEDVESSLRAAADSEGFRPIEGEAVEFGYHELGREDIEDQEDLEEYLEECQGKSIAELALYTTQRGGHRRHDYSEGISVDIEFNPEKFHDVYPTLSENLDISRIGFDINGFGENGHQAYQTATPVLSFMLGEEKDAGIVVSYRNGGTIEEVWGPGEEMKNIIQTAKQTDLNYNGAAITGEKEEAWINSTTGRDLYNLK